MSAPAGNLFAMLPAGATPVTALRRFSGLAVQDILVFLIPLSGFIELHLVGRLFAPDMIMLVLSPFLMMSMGRRLADPLPKMFIVLGLVWLLGQVVTDIVRHIPFHDYARGWAKIAFTLINFCVIYLLINNRPRRIILYAAGLVGGGILGFYLNPNIYTAGHPWKFGVGWPLTLLIIISAALFMDYRRQHRLLAIGLVAFAAAFNVYMGFRSLGGICFLTTTYLILQLFWRRRYAHAMRVKPRNIVLPGLVLVFAGFVVMEAYEHAAGSGLLGEASREKYEVQAMGKYGLLLGSRSEILVAGQAVMDSPLLGHGSWAKNWNYAELFVELKHRLGYAAGSVNELGLIPTHSHIMGAWVEAGILGAIFWFWVLLLTVRTLASLYQTKTRLAPLVVFFATTLIWDVFFSPYGAERRFVTPYYAIVMIIFLSSGLGVQRRRKLP